MSGHSKWNNIKRTKEKSDAAKGKIFTKIGREIAVCVKMGGADPLVNSSLKDVITKAKQNNMPNDTIARSIKKASGEMGNVNYSDVVYEGYGVGGSAVIVKCLTDNKNRTAGDVRHAFDKFGGSLGSNGCVSYLFKNKGIVLIEKDIDTDLDVLMLDALDLGATDVEEEEDVIRVETEVSDYNKIADSLAEKKYKVLSQEACEVPDSYISLDENQLTTFGRMIELLEDSDDVQNVYHNVENFEE